MFNAEINWMNEGGRKNRSSQDLYLFSKLHAQVYMKSDYTLFVNTCPNNFKLYVLDFISHLRIRSVNLPLAHKIGNFQQSVE